jgi:Spy/CpxP family protein refolding chaperone
MKRRNTIITVVFAVAALAALPLLAEMHRGHGAGPGGEMFIFGALQHARQELGITDAQADQLKGIAKELREQNQQYREQLRGGHAAIMKTLLADPNNVAGAQAIIDQQSAAERAMKSNLLAAASKALNVLTPEQRTKLGTLIAERHSHKMN